MGIAVIYFKSIRKRRENNENVNADNENFKKLSSIFEYFRVSSYIFIS